MSLADNQALQKAPFATLFEIEGSIFNARRLSALATRAFEKYKNENIDECRERVVCRLSRIYPATVCS